MYCFVIHSARLYILFEAFNPHTCKVIVDNYVLIFMYLIFLDSYFGFFSSLPLYLVFSFYLLTIFSVMSGLLFLFLCDHYSYLIFGSHFICYIHLYVCRIVSACWSLNFRCIFNILHLYSPLLMIVILFYLLFLLFLIVIPPMHFFYCMAW